MEIFAFLISAFVLLLTSEVWLPIMGLYGAFKFITTLSISVAWEAAISVPIWIWNFTNGLF